MSLIWPRKKRHVPPYTKLAGAYDYLMKHVDYVEWADYIDVTLKKMGNPILQIVDVACGTGNFLFELARKKSYQLSGFDQIAEMVGIAEQKARQKGVSIPLWRGNMLDFQLRQPQDAIVCLYDSINYLLTLDNCQRFYQQCHANLKSRGILIFDICTEWNSIVHFQNYVGREKTTAFNVVRKSYYDAVNRMHHNDFTIGYVNEPYVYFEQHLQKIFYIDEIIDSISPELFEIKGIFNGFTWSKGTENSERVHFVLQKCS